MYTGFAPQGDPLTVRTARPGLHLRFDHDRWPDTLLSARIYDLDRLPGEHKQAAAIRGQELQSAPPFLQFDRRADSGPAFVSGLKALAKMMMDDKMLEKEPDWDNFLNLGYA